MTRNRLTVEEPAKDTLDVRELNCAGLLTDDWIDSFFCPWDRFSRRLVGRVTCDPRKRRPPAQRITLVVFAAIGSVLAIASAVGTLWAWTSPDVEFGFKIMFPVLTAALFALLFLLGMTLLSRPD